MYYIDQCIEKYNLIFKNILCNLPLTSMPASFYILATSYDITLNLPCIFLNTTFFFNVSSRNYSANRSYPCQLKIFTIMINKGQKGNNSIYILKFVKVLIAKYWLVNLYLRTRLSRSSLSKYSYIY